MGSASAPAKPSPSLTAPSKLRCSGETPRGRNGEEKANSREAVNKLRKAAEGSCRALAVAAGA